MNDTTATSEHIAKVLDAIKRLRPFDIGSIMDDTGLPNDIVLSAIRSLEQEGIVRRSQCVRLSKARLNRQWS